MTKRLQDLIKSMDSLHHFLPPNDAVLNALSDRVSQYHNLVSLLKQLSSKAVKVHVHVKYIIHVHVHTLRRLETLQASISRVILTFLVMV